MATELKNQPCYDKEGNFIGWFSRSTAACVAVVAFDKEDRCYILGAQRGPGAADFQGKWNLPCGYIDFNETAIEAACRECFEETGVTIDKDYCAFLGYEDSPTANRQNITFRFLNLIMDKKMEEVKFSQENNEEGEVSQIMWVDLESYKEFDWAFGHEKVIERVVELMKEAKEFNEKKK